MRISDETTAVIIGGGGGVGRGIALGLAGKGARLVIADIDEATAARVAESRAAAAKAPASAAPTSSRQAAERARVRAICATSRLWVRRVR